ncbi:hypothetical protein EJ02DRAFT_379791 [Clathrospora elynae]|uniref:4'-phosphopantetheinyl transferase domain-containing protein n=1 Tax=Clathrospora elynae TaxID=706981 RepID=A0A6A5SKS1_9PLEO|nr:hypothetical protein EJ02DRAFT_379791 [Clathrospora elynae]
MPPRPFPFPFRVGTDLCKVSRVHAIITRHSPSAPLRPLRQFLHRILTDQERQYFWTRFGSSDQILTQAAAVSQFLAGRFAAKEACRKACVDFERSSRGFRHIIILPVTAPDGDAQQSVRPQGLILDQAYEEACATPAAKDADMGVPVGKTQVRSSVDVDELAGQLCEISISHDGDFATAVALVPWMEKKAAI